MPNPKHKMSLEHLLIPKILVARPTIQDTERSTSGLLRPRRRVLEWLGLDGWLLVGVEGVDAALLGVHVGSREE